MILELGAPFLMYGVMASKAESDTARYVAEQMQEGHGALYQTYTFGHEFAETIEGLAAVERQCGKPGWDGYDAEPVHRETIGAARRLLESLPHGIPGPAVGAEPDGHITLEWYRSPHRTLSIGIAPDDSLHYSALLGPNRLYGTEIFFGEVPTLLVDLIHRVKA